MASLNTLERYGSPFLPTANTSVPPPAPTSLFTIDSPPPTTQPLQQTSSFFSALAPPTTTSGKSYLNTVYKNPFTFTVRAAVIDGDLPKLKKILVAHGLPIQSPNPENGWPLLFYAIQYNKNEIVKFLLDSGHESTGISKDFRKNTALHIAADYKNEIAFNMYLNLYPQTAFLVNKDGKSPLIIATLRGLNDLIIKLLEMGADVNSVDGDASTPLHHAAAWGYYETVGLLLSSSALYNTKNKHGFTPFDYAYSLDMRDHLQECATAVAEGKPVQPLVYAREQARVQKELMMQQQVQRELVQMAGYREMVEKKEVEERREKRIEREAKERMDLRGLF